MCPHAKLAHAAQSVVYEDQLLYGGLKAKMRGNACGSVIVSASTICANGCLNWLFPLTEDADLLA